MITKELIQKVEKFAYSEIEKYQAPSKFQIDLSKEKGQWLACLLNANKEIVYLGTLLMDCALGKAMLEKRIKEHVKMSVEKTASILNKNKDISQSEKENIIACVAEHHGVSKFFSIESEICCNADCYRFASVQGFLGGIRFTRDMELDELIKLMSLKSDEKWNALTISVCKKELEPQYRAIKELLAKGGLV